MSVTAITDSKQQHELNETEQVDKIHSLQISDDYYDYVSSTDEDIYYKHDLSENNDGFNDKHEPSPHPSSGPSYPDNSSTYQIPTPKCSTKEILHLQTADNLDKITMAILDQTLDNIFTTSTTKRHLWPTP